MSNLVALGECTDRCVTWNPAADDPDGEFDYIDLSSVDKGTKRIEGVSPIACADAPSRARQIVKTGDILVSTVRPNLNGVAAVPIELDGATASTGYTVLRPRSDRVDGSYLFHWVKHPEFVGEMVRLATGASYPAVSDKIVRAAMIPLPPLPEQRRIAAILDKADALRAKRREAIAKLDQLEQSVFIEMFGDPFDTAASKKHVPFRELTRRITYGFTSPMSHIETGIPILTAKNIKDGNIDFEKVHYAARHEFDALTAKSKPNAGDILITKDGSIGRCAVVPDVGELCINQSVALVVPNRNKAQPAYISAYIRSLPVQRRIQMMGKGNALKHLQITELADFPTVLPSIDDQSRFSLVIDSIEAQKARLRDQAAELECLFSSAQHDSFGKFL